MEQITKSIFHEELNKNLEQQGYFKEVDDWYKKKEFWDLTGSSYLWGFLKVAKIRKKAIQSVKPHMRKQVISEGIWGAFKRMPKTNPVLFLFLLFEFSMFTFLMTLLFMEKAWLTNLIKIPIPLFVFLFVGLFIYRGLKNNWKESLPNWKHVLLLTLFFALLSIGDISSTVYFMNKPQFGTSAEANLGARWFAEHFGILNGLVLHRLICLPFVFLLYLSLSHNKLGFNISKLMMTFVFVLVPILNMVNTML